MLLEQLIKELNDIFTSIDFEENGGLYISKAEWTSDDLRLVIVIKTGVDDQKQLREIQVKGVRDELIKSDLAESMNLYEEHPLLWSHNQMQVSLYFSQPTNRPHELLTDITALHNRKTANWIRLEKYLNSGLTAIELCKSNSGLFARGPINLLEEYKSVLEVFSMHATILNGHNPKRWVNGYQVDETEILKVLVIGNSYIIAESFDFIRLNNI